MPAGELCLHEACHKTEVQHSAPAIYLPSLKLMSMNGVAQQCHIHACYLKLFDLFLLITQLLVKPGEHMIDYC